MKGEKKILAVNAVVSIISQVIILLFGLIIPRLVLTNYGSDVNGFTSTISQLFTYMALLEAGISQSARNLLYKPIKDKNEEEISYYVSAARNNFRSISKYYFVAVIVFGLAMPLVLKTKIDNATIFFYILFEGLTGVVSFCFLEPIRCLLNVDGKHYVNNIVNTITNILMYGSKMVMALLGVNIAFIQLVYFVISLIAINIYHVYAKRNYPWINYNCAPKNIRLKDRTSFVITEFAWTVFSSTDLIVLSAFISTKMSSVYSVYNMVFVAINQIVNTVYRSTNYRLGQIYVKDIQEYINTHDLFNSVFIGGMTILMSITYVIIPYFVKLYTRGVTDINYTYAWLPLLFCLVQLFSWSRSIAGNLISISGRIKKAVWVSIVEAIMNITLSVTLVNFCGVTGVILATVCSLPLKIIYNNYVADVVILHRSIKRTALIIFGNIAFFSTIVIVTNKYINLPVYSYADLLLFTVPIALVTLILGVGVNAICNTNLVKHK